MKGQTVACALGHASLQGDHSVRELALEWQTASTAADDVRVRGTTKKRKQRNLWESMYFQSSLTEQVRGRLLHPALVALPRHPRVHALSPLSGFRKMLASDPVYFLCPRFEKL